MNYIINLEKYAIMQLNFKNKTQKQKDSLIGDGYFFIQEMAKKGKNIEIVQVKEGKTYPQLKAIHKLCDIYKNYMSEAMGYKISFENAKISLKYAVEYVRLANEDEAFAEALRLKREKELLGEKITIKQFNELVKGLMNCYRVPKSFKDATLEEMQQLIEEVHELGRKRGWHNLILTSVELDEMINYFKGIK